MEHTTKEIAVHPTAIVSSGAELAEAVEIGAYAVIGRDVRIGAGTVVSSHAVIEDHTHIGEHCTIASFTSLGAIPQDLKFRGEESRVIIGNYNSIREFVTINRATREDIGATIIGDHNLIMAYCHVAHNCQLGNNIVLANATNLAGHIVIEDYAVLGGLTGVHQFTRIGRHAMIGGASAVSKDIPPFVTASGNRAKLYGLNLIGLRRRSFKEETIQALQKAYRIIFRSRALLPEAVERVRKEVDAIPEVEQLLDFIQKSKRGVCR